MPPPAHYVRLGRSIEGPYAPEEVRRRLDLGLLSTLHEVSADRVNWRPLGAEPEAIATGLGGTDPLDALDDATNNWPETPAPHNDDALIDAPLPPPRAPATTFARSTAAAAGGLLAATGAVLLADTGTRAAAWIWVLVGGAAAGAAGFTEASQRRRLGLSAATAAGVGSLGLAAARPHVVVALPLLPGLAWCAAARIRQHFQCREPAPDPAGATGLGVGLVAAVVALAAIPNTTFTHAAAYLPALALAAAVGVIALKRPAAPLVPLATAAAVALVGAAHLRSGGVHLTAFVGGAVGLAAAAALLIAARLEADPNPTRTPAADSTPASPPPLALPPEPRPPA